LPIVQYGDKADDMLKIGYRHQRTLSRAAVISGPGLITGAPVQVKLHPAPENTGVVFVRSDRPGYPVIPARAEWVSSTQRRTTLGGGESAVTLVEHLLATLAGLRVDNCVIELDGPEPPGLDGSAAGFVDAVLKSGYELLSARRSVWAVQESVVVQHGGATVAVHPAPADSPNELLATYMLDYGADSDIPRQSHTMKVSPETFAREVADCRTFVLEREALTLRSVGVGRHLTAKDLLVFGSHGLIDNKLRHANEPARHKVLDLIGDLSLCGVDLIGHVVAYRSGHSLNVSLAKALILRARAAGADIAHVPDVPPALRRAIFPGRRQRVA